jgi:hypothetical protein
MTEKKYSHERYAALLEYVSGEIQKLAKLKGGEYAGDIDRLANFRRNGENLELPMEAIWGVYVAKHYDAIGQYIRDKVNGTHRDRLEPIAGRAMDIIVYMTLFIAMVDEDIPMKEIDDILLEWATAKELGR